MMGPKRCGNIVEHKTRTHPLPADRSCHRARHIGCTARGHLQGRTSPASSCSASKHTQHTSASCTVSHQIHQLEAW